MLSNEESLEGQTGPFRSVAEGAWALQAQHERFLFKKGRPRSHPSRVAWASANKLWCEEIRAGRRDRLAAT
jgi:hypothetical protein